MKNCPKCNAQLQDDAMFCTNCGTAFQPQQAQPQNNTQPPQAQNVNNAQQNQYNAYQQNNQMPNNYQQPNNAQMPNQQYVQPAPAFNPYDHTAEFDAKDVSENKIFALLMYLTSIFGVIIALLANKTQDSPYLKFHIRQVLNIVVLQTLVGVLSGLLFWTCLAPIAGSVCIVILLVVTIICFINTCSNKSIEAPIVRSFGFLK